MKKQLFNTLNQKKFHIYDFDYTIVKLHENWGNVFTTISNYLDTKFPHQEFNDIMHSGTKEYMQQMSESELQELREIWSKSEVDNFISYEPNNELIDYIKKAKQEKFLCTSNTSKLVVMILQELDLYKQFETCVFMDSVKALKPDPAGINSIIKSNGGDLGDYIMIGDNPLTDGKAAKAAGIEYLKIEL